MNRRDFLVRSGAAVSLSMFARGLLSDQTPPPSPPLSAGPPIRPPTLVTNFQLLRRDVGFFTGRGGTIGWLASPDALVAVDTQFPDTAGIFLEKMPGRAGRTLDAVINTHHHWDHTAGNAVFRPATKTIVAHQSVPVLQADAFQRNPQQGPPTLPDTLFADAWRQAVGDEMVSAKYFGPSHTGGDIAVCFERANVVHLGDLVFNRLYPVTDRPGGCHLRHWISALETVTQTYPPDAIYLFGHGQQKFGVTGGRADVLVFRDYLAALLAHVEREIKAGKTKAEIGRLENLPGFPDLHVPPGPGNRLGVNLSVAFDELTGT